MPQSAIPNFLLPRPGKRFNPYSHWKTYKDKEVIFTLIDETVIGMWDVHPEGIIMETNDSLLVNGKKVASKRERERERKRHMKCGQAIAKDS